MQYILLVFCPVFFSLLLLFFCRILLCLIGLHVRFNTTSFQCLKVNVFYVVFYVCIKKENKIDEIVCLDVLCETKTPQKKKNKTENLTIHVSRYQAGRLVVFAEFFPVFFCCSFLFVSYFADADDEKLMLTKTKINCFRVQSWGHSRKKRKLK